MSDPTNEFQVVPDSPEAHLLAEQQAAEAAAAAAAAVTDTPSAPTDDITSEPAAGDSTPTPSAPEPATSVVQEPEMTSENARSAKIHGLHEDPNTLGLEGRALETKIKLSKEPKVRMMIPFDPGERKGAYRTIVINGYRFDVQKNVMVDLPESVAALISDSYRITQDVVDNAPTNLANADAGKRSALGM